MENNENNYYNTEEPQNNYQYNTTYNATVEDRGNESPMSMGEWLLTMLVLLIPCAGFCLYIYWAFSKTGNVNRRNYCRASLILSLIGFVLYFIIIIVIGVAISNMPSLYGY